MSAEAVLQQIDYDENSALFGDINVMRGVITSRTGISLREEELKYRHKVLELRKRCLTNAVLNSALAKKAEHLFYNATNDLSIGLL